MKRGKQSAKVGFVQGYACCLAALIRMEGGVTATVRELFKAGIGSVENAGQAGVDAADLETLQAHQTSLET